MSEDEARRLVKRWHPGQLLSLSGLELEHLVELPPNLEELDISNNNITDFSSLPKSLRKLIYHESYGLITNLDIDLPNLKVLDLSYNNIKSIERLPKGLTSLNLSYSENLKEVINLPNGLKILDVSNSKELEYIQLPETLKSLVIKNCRIDDLSSIEMNEGLKRLDCSNNYIDTIERLPSSLEFLNCSKNRLTSLPELPSGMTHLNYSDNQIDKYVELPSELLKLNVSNNDIKVIPIIPPKLDSLYCDNCSLINLPPLPPTLISLSCKGNKIKKIKSLPPRLLSLTISDNPISELDSLPGKLELLKIANCSFDEIPTLPSKLYTFDCSGIFLRTIPELPATLTHLYMNNNKLVKLPTLPINLMMLECSNNSLTKLPKLPKTLGKLDCSYNLIKKLPSLPYRLLNLNCSHNSLTEFPYVNNLLRVLDISHNLLTDLPYPIDDEIEVLNISYNKLTKLEIKNPNLKLLDISYNKLKSVSSFPRNKYDINLEGNPVYEGIAPELKTPYLDYTVRRLGSEKVNITTIPKGTVLFKGFSLWNQDKMISDYVGWYKEGGTYSYVWPNFNVFFYPYPFVIEEINIVSPEILMITNVLQNDVNVVLGVLPSDNSRNDRHSSEYLKTCADIKVSEHFEGLYYDPCLNPEFISQNQDVVGDLFISGSDASRHKKISGSNLDFVKYRHFFQDKNNFVGVPELVLYPFKKREVHELKFNIEETSNFEWIMENLDKYNYRPISIDKHTAYTESDFKILIDKLLTPEGAEIGGILYHMTIDTKTLFFVIAELADQKTLERCLPINYTNKLEFLN